VLYYPAMRRLLPITLLALTLFGSVALADRHDRRYDRRNDRRGPVVRDHRDYRPAPRPVVRRDRRVITRNRVYVANGRYVFHNGVTRSYVRPVIRHRYFDVRVRPTLIVENYQPVPGYVWVAGNWQWNGREWMWTSGYFAPDTRYRVWYDDGSWE